MYPVWMGALRALRLVRCSCPRLLWRCAPWPCGYGECGNSKAQMLWWKFVGTSETKFLWGLLEYPCCLQCYGLKPLSLKVVGRWLPCSHWATLRCLGNVDRRMEETFLRHSRECSDVSCLLCPHSTHVVATMLVSQSTVGRIGSILRGTWWCHRVRSVSSLWTRCRRFCR